VQAESVLSRERSVRFCTAPNRWRRGRPFSPRDPVPTLDESEIDLFRGGLNSGEVRKIIESYLERMATYYYEAHGFPETLRAFLDGNRNAKEVFVSALDPRYDDIAGAARIFEDLRCLDEKTLLKYLHLATAIAVVYDTPDAVESSRFNAVWGVSKDQFPELPLYRSAWDYFTDRSNALRFRFPIDRLPWPILVHLVDNDTSPEDASWARRRYAAVRRVGGLYGRVPYDYEKFNDRPPTLGSRPYSLPNLLQFGGVCVERAHFMTRVAKCLGIPAMKVSGANRYGSHHCWAGYLESKKGRPVLEFTGRYFMDYYYTGDIYDPQTRTVTLDRFVAMMYDGASLSYPKYNESQMLVRLAEGARQDHPSESLALAQQALKRNYFNMWAWPLLVQHIKDGTLPKTDGLKWFNTMLQVLRDHPDMTFECLGTFLDCFPRSEVRQRQSLYDQAFRLYRERPDLQLKLRTAQTEELVSAGEKLQALNVLIPTIVNNAKEGPLVLPAAEMAVRLAKEFEVGRQVHGMLEKADRDFPKQRAGKLSPAYEEFKKLLDSLN
jgi:hypothetical protein